MKKGIALLLITLLLMALAACGGSAGSQTDETTALEGTAVPPADSVPQPVDGTPVFQAQGEMPDGMTLALATFKLDETDTPIDAAQAAQLLPLWKAARSLSESETVASAEIEALFKQICNSLTVEQQTAIDAMDLTPQDMGTIAEKYGFELGFGGRMGNMDESTRATVEALRASGQMPGAGQGPGGGQGGPPGEGGVFIGPGGGMAGSGMDPQVMETAIAERGGSRGAMLGLPSALLDAVITFLESKS